MPPIRKRRITTSDGVVLNLLEAGSGVPLFLVLFLARGQAEVTPWSRLPMWLRYHPHGQHVKKYILVLRSGVNIPISY